MEPKNFKGDETVNWFEELKKVLKQYWWTLLIFLVGIPFLIHALFKWHTCAFLEWDPKAGSMLEFYGAVLGGGITLLVLWITTDETRKIQKKNEDQLEDDRKEREREKRKAFADSVIEDIAMFCTDAAAYKECRVKIYKYNSDLKGLNVERRRIQKDLENEYKSAVRKRSSAVVRIQQLRIEEKNIEQEIENTRKNARELFTSRRIAQERYLVLRIKLKELDRGDEIIDMMKHLMTIGTDDSIDYEAYCIENDKLVALISEFVEGYINV